MVIHFRRKSMRCNLSFIAPAQQNLLFLNTGFNPKKQFAVWRPGMISARNERVSEVWDTYCHKSVTLQDSNRHLSSYTGSCSRNTPLFTAGSARTRSARLRSCAACNEGVRACRILLSADLLGFHFFFATLQTLSYFFPSRNTGALRDYCHSPPACHTPCFQVWSLWGDCRSEPLWKINGRQERAKKTGQMALSPPPAWCHESSSVPLQMPLCSTDLLWSWSNCTLGSCLSSFL